MAKLRAQIPGAKVIGFPRGAGTLLERYVGDIPVNAVGIDWSVDRGFVRERVQSRVPVQGNLDPLVLVAGGAALDRAIDAILEAFRGGSVVVAASGDSRGIDFSPYPASYPHVLAVASTDRKNQVSFFSGPSSSNDIAAPGEDITVAVPVSHDPSGYAVASGTSYSAALVSGAVAWIWTRRPTLTNTQLITLIHRTAEKLGPDSFNNDTGYGLLDADRRVDRGDPLHRVVCGQRSREHLSETHSARDIEQLRLHGAAKVRLDHGYAFSCFALYERKIGDQRGAPVVGVGTEHEDHARGFLLVVLEHVA